MAIATSVFAAMVLEPEVGTWEPSTETRCPVLVAVLVEAVSRLQGKGRCERLAIDADDQPAEIQERALSSSIWYTP